MTNSDHKVCNDDLRHPQQQIIRQAVGKGWVTRWWGLKTLLVLISSTIVAITGHLCISHHKHYRFYGNMDLGKREGTQRGRA